MTRLCRVFLLVRLAGELGTAEVAVALGLDWGHTLSRMAIRANPLIFRNCE